MFDSNYFIPKKPEYKKPFPQPDKIECPEKKEYCPEKKEHCPKKKDICPQLPGTILRVFIPAGAVINLLKIIEVVSPSGICLIIRLPILADKCDKGLYDIVGAIRQAGGTVEFVS